MKLKIFKGNKDDKKVTMGISKKVIDAQKSNAETDDFGKMMGLGFIKEEVKISHK